MLRFVNFIGALLALIVLFIFIKQDKIHLTQEVLDLFPATADREIVNTYESFSRSRFVLVAIKGFGEEAARSLDSFLSRIEGLRGVLSSSRDTRPPPELQDFVKSYYPFVATPREEPLEIKNEKQILKKLENDLKAYLASAPSGNSPPKADQASPPLNPLDPLGLFSLREGKTDALSIKDYGYLAVVELEQLESQQLLETLEDFAKIAKDYPQIRYFSPNFMQAKNLSLILTEANYLLGFASLAFVVLYFLIIRIPLLTINTICTLVLANIVAILVVSSLYPKVTIMALSFGMGLSNIAIDYMMHHNFFGLYARGAAVFNRSVFYGYLTTMVGFAACLFIPFPLLAQLSLYAMVSLSMSYLCFAFIYPRVGFREPRLFKRLALVRRPRISSLFFLAVSILFFIGAGKSLRLDFDLSKLDYQNKEMLEEREFFKSAKGEGEVDILLSSSSLDGLIALSHLLQARLDSLGSQTLVPLALIPTERKSLDSKEFLESNTMQHYRRLLSQALLGLEKQLGSKAELKDLVEILKSSYEVREPPVLTTDSLDKLGFHIVTSEAKAPILEGAVKEGGEKGGIEAPADKTYYYLTSIPKTALGEISNLLESQALDSLDSIDRDLLARSQASLELRSLESIIDSITEEVYAPMLAVLALAFGLMTAVLAWLTRGGFLDSYVFILFPLSAALFVVSLHSPINLMHLFALLILVVVSIDYGIYSTREGGHPRSAHAIFFSSLTTGLSFGVLISSQTKALNSFGEIIFVGMACVLFMLIFHRPRTVFGI